MSRRSIARGAALPWLVSFVTALVVVVTPFDATAEDLNEYLDRGRASYSEGDYDAALESLEAGFRAAAAEGNKQAVTVFMFRRSLWDLYDVLGQYDRALWHYEQWLQIGRDVKSPAGEAGFLNGMGLISSSLDRHDRALWYLERSLVIFRGLEDRYGEAGLLHNIGNVYRYLGQYGRALGYYNQSLAINRELERRYVEALSLHSIGILYEALGLYEWARGSYEQALAIARDLEDHPYLEASLREAKGLVYEATGQYGRAIFRRYD